MALLFGREEGAVLVAVERANGGELAPLLQVIWALYSFTPPGSRPSPAEFAASATALVELGVIEYVDHQLGLTPDGRKLLRRSGMPNSPKHLIAVTDLLQEFDSADLRLAGASETPTEAEVRLALSDGDQIEETGGVGTPVIGGEAAVFGASGLYGSHWVPAVLPAEAGGGAAGEAPGADSGNADSGNAAAGDPDDDPSEAARFSGAPAHPVLDRLFGHRRRDGSGPD